MKYTESQQYHQPVWLEYPLSGYDIAAIIQGGCESGAYMPAVTYHKANETMSKHGDDVLRFIEDHTGESPPAIDSGESWSGYACRVLSYAVELFAFNNEDQEDWENDQPITC